MMITTTRPYYRSDVRFQRSSCPAPRGNIVYSRVALNKAFASEGDEALQRTPSPPRSPLTVVHRLSGHELPNSVSPLPERHVDGSQKCRSASPARPWQANSGLEAVQDSFIRGSGEQPAAMDKLVMQWESRFAALETYIQDRTAKCDENRANICDMETHLKHNTCAIEAIECRMTSLEAGFQKTAHTIEGVSSYMHGGDIHLQSILQHLEQIQSKVPELERELQNNTHAIGQIQPAMSSLEADLLQNAQATKDIKSQVSRLENHLLDSVYPLAGLQPQVLSLEADVQKTKHTSEVIQAKISEFSCQVGRLDRVIEDVTESHRRYVMNLMKLIQTTQHDVAQLGEVLAADKKGLEIVKTGIHFGSRAGAGDNAFPSHPIAGSSGRHLRMTDDPSNGHIFDVLPGSSSTTQSSMGRHSVGNLVSAHEIHGKDVLTNGVRLAGPAEISIDLGLGL